MVAIVPDIELLKNEEALASVLAEMRSASRNGTILDIPSLSGNNSDILSVLSEVQELSNDNGTLSEDERRQLSKSMHARMVAVALGLRGSIEDGEHIVPIMLSDLVSFAQFDEFVIVLPEDISGPIEEQAMLHDLELLFDKTGTRVKWVIDCSGLKTFSGLLFGNLIFYQDKLRENGKGLYLHWLPEGILEQRQLSVLIRVLNLIKIGGQLFSSDEIEKT